MKTLKRFFKEPLLIFKSYRRLKAERLRLKLQINQLTRRINTLVNYPNSTQAAQIRMHHKVTNLIGTFKIKTDEQKMD